MGVNFRVKIPKGVSEEPKPGENPESLVRRLAYEKARSVALLFPKDWVLGADTVVVYQNKIFTKPRNRREAERTLKSLEGRDHEVLTGVCLMRAGSRRCEIHVEKTMVSFRCLTPGERKAYLNTPEPYDKAGAYDIQGAARNWIVGWDGDYFNVMGLPVRWFLARLK